MSNLNSAHDEETDAFAPVSISIIKKKRSLPGHPDPDAEVIALSPRSLLATNRFVCEICNKGFQRDQNLQLHRRGHNLPWRLKQKASHEVKKKVYICPESSCIHHDPARALGDLTGIKKHFSRKHGEKKWKCDKCSKRYAVQSDWKAHQKTCGTREYRCDCGTLFSRRDSFITHRAFCDAMAEENAKVSGHRQGESQQSAASLDNNAPFGGDLSAAMDAPSSPISQLTGDALTSSDISKPILAKRASDFALPEGGIASLSSKWVQGGIGANGAALSKGPGLSLCLGMDPGPGPPGALQMMGNQIPSGSGPPFIMPSSKVLNNLGFSRMMPGSESHDTGMHVPSSTSAMGMLASMFSSSGNGCSRHDASNGMAGVSGYAGLMNHHDRPTMPSFVMPHSGLPTSISSMMNEFVNANGPSKASLHHTASAPMSATALLQKAAQMGATASNPSVFQKFGMGVGESSSSKDAGGIQRQPSWAGVSSIISSSAPAYSKMRQAGDLRIDSSDRGAGGSAFPSVSGHGSMQEFMNSMSGGAGLCGGAALHDMPSPGGTYSNGNNFLRHDMLRDKEQSNALNGRPSFGAGAAPQPGRGGGQRREHEGGTPMLDFLGVGGPSGMVVAAGASAGIGQILSQKDLASITSLNAGIKMDKSLSYQSDNKGAARQLYPS